MKWLILIPLAAFGTWGALSQPVPAAAKSIKINESPVASIVPTVSPIIPEPMQSPVLSQANAIVLRGNSLWTATTTTVFVECTGSGGGTFGNFSRPAWSGGGGGAYSASTLTLIVGKTYETIVCGDNTQFFGPIEGQFLPINGVPTFVGVSVVAQAGYRSMLSGPTLPVPGGQATNGVGQIKFSGGSGGVTYPLDGWINGVDIGVRGYVGGEGGMPGSASGNGRNGASGLSSYPNAAGNGAIYLNNRYIEARPAIDGQGCGATGALPPNGGAGWVRISW
jgi:hypothetical protein